MEVAKGRKAHVLCVPLPSQGHVKPLMKLGRQIAKHGIKVTIVNLQRIHNLLVAAAKVPGEEDDNITLATIPDIPRADYQNDPLNIMNPLRRVLPGSLTDLIHRINACNPDEKISCLIADTIIGHCIWETAQKMGAKTFLFSPASAATIAMIFRIPDLLEQGLFDSNGNIKKGEVRLSDDVPGWGEGEFTWSFPSNRVVQKMFFEDGAKLVDDKIRQSKWVLVNTCYELEPSGCHLNPTFLPIGPLLETSDSSSNPSNFFPEDESCLSWLDGKPPASVIYVSFGSVAVFSQQQLDELALGLELSGRAFLWVVRSDLANMSRATYPDGFLERVSEIGKIVGWAPQERVLSHPSLAGFLSHCGWNSILEGTSKGVPFLCWPYFSDQFHNQNYVCDEWETGLRISPDDNGIRSRHEIKKKIDMLFSNHDLKANALALKEACEKSVSEGGTSHDNLKIFVDHIRNSASSL